MAKRIIGITMGDPGSIGPEITVKVFSDNALYSKCNAVVIGDAVVMERAKHMVSHSDIQINPITSIKQARFHPGIIDVLDMKVVDINKLEIGKVSKMCGKASFIYIKKAIELAMKKEINGIVTNAINKEAINMAGYHYSGHTEIFAEFTKTKNYTMMLVHENLRVVHVSTHVSLREACDRVKKERVLEVIRIADNVCKKLGIEDPKIGVAGLNPHSGENGLFGKEEIEEIIPAIQSAKMEGINAQGPFPADTIFSKARGGWYDIVVAMYHDQGHIPLKVLGFIYDPKEKRWNSVSGINITLGLPIIRTSVDHGTAFDQAGLGTASEISLKNAIDYSILLTNNSLLQ